MNVLIHPIGNMLSRFFAAFFLGPVFDGGRYLPASPQIGMCMGPVLLFQVGIIILFSIFLADAVRVTVSGLQKSAMDPKVARHRAQQIAQVFFVLFVILGCAAMWFMYRDFYIP